MTPFENVFTYDFTARCVYCKMTSRANNLYAGRYGYGRGIFYCQHSKVKELPLSAFGNKAPGFIAFGTTEKDSVVQVKTHPRWCPAKGGTG